MDIFSSLNPLQPCSRKDLLLFPVLYVGKYKQMEMVNAPTHQLHKKTEPVRRQETGEWADILSTCHVGNPQLGEQLAAVKSEETRR